MARGDRPQLLVEADATDPSATGGAVAALAALPDRALAHDLTGALAARGQAAPPFEVVVHRRYNPEAITSYNIVPGLLGIILSLTLVMMTALSVTRETERGTMESLLATPVEPLEVMAGKLAPYVGNGLIQTVIILLLPRLLFEVPRDQAEEVAGLVQDRMQRAAALNVPLTVDVGIGENWKEAKG